MKVYSEQRRAAQAKTMQGRKQSEETKAKISQANSRSRNYCTVITPKGEFESIAATARAYNMTPGAVVHRLKSGLDGWRRGIRVGKRENSLIITDPNGREWTTIPSAADAWDMTLVRMTCLLRREVKKEDSKWKITRANGSAWTPS